MKRKEYNWSLPEKITDRLSQASYGKQRAIYEDNALLIILHQVPEHGQTEREHQIFFKDPENGDWFFNGKSQGEKQLKVLLNNYHEKFDKYEDDLEKAKSSGDLFELIQDLTPINRSIKNLSNALQAAREYVKSDSIILECRDISYDLSRNYEILFSDAKLSLDFKIAQNAEKQAIQTQQSVVSQHRLNLLAAFFFPLISIATIFGMNFAHGFSEEKPLYFWIILIMGLMLGFFIRKWVVKDPPEC